MLFLTIMIIIEFNKKICGSFSFHEFPCSQRNAKNLDSIKKYITPFPLFDKLRDIIKFIINTNDIDFIRFVYDKIDKKYKKICYNIL